MLFAAGIAMMPLLSLTMTLGGPPAPASPPVTGFLYKTLDLDGQRYAYCVFVPPDYKPDQAWPVVLFLHGSGERGDDGFLQTEIGIGRALRRNHRQVPAIVVMPQCRPGQLWVGPMAVLALRCLEETSREYHLDAERIYLTGLSMGGHGAWLLAAELPGRFAAVVPVCGFAELGPSTGLAQRLAPRLKDVPIRVFHGALDTNVPAEKSREMAEAIRQAGGQVFYTEFPDGAHDIWDRVYGDPQVWRWLLEQRRSKP